MGMLTKYMKDMLGPNPFDTSYTHRGDSHDLTLRSCMSFIGENYVNFIEGRGLRRCYTVRLYSAAECENKNVLHMFIKDCYPYA